jgi:hypothetical protein
MRAWVVVAVVYAAVVVLWNVLSLVPLLTTLLVAKYSDRFPSNVMVGHSAGPFPWGYFIV